MENTNYNSQSKILNSESSILNSEFDAIRPYEAGEMKEAFNELLNDRHFNAVMKGFVPWMPKAVRNGVLRLAFTGVKTPLDFQKRFMKPVVKYIIKKHTDGCTFDDSELRMENSELGIGNSELGIENYSYPAGETANVHSDGKSNPNSPFQILNSQSSILNSQSSILNSQSSILNSQSSILNSQSSILNSQSSILNPQSSILNSKRFTFISNHRDIVLDSALLDVMLIDAGHPTTVEIGIGDNLLIYPWIERLVRMNKAFIVRRGLSLRETLAASQLMSRYIHYAVTQKHENIWLAQREGRAKDSSDHTQDAVLKMLAMGGTVPSQLSAVRSALPLGSAKNSQLPTVNCQLSTLNSLRELNIVPLTISYEYDPCDYLKAQEFQQKRDNPAYKKSRQDDLDNMRTGILGYKGRVHYHCATPVNNFIDEFAELPKTEFFTALARRIDQELHRHYRLYPVNYAAAHLSGLTAEASECARLLGLDDAAAREAVSHFETYLSQQIAKVSLPQKDEMFLRERMLTMYVNPLLNHLAAL